MIFNYILHVFTTMSDYYYLVYYNDYTSLQTFPLRNILGFNNINKSTLGLIAKCQIILALNENFKANFDW